MLFVRKIENNRQPGHLVENTLSALNQTQTNQLAFLVTLHASITISEIVKIIAVILVTALLSENQPLNHNVTKYTKNLKTASPTHELHNINATYSNYLMQEIPKIKLDILYVHKRVVYFHQQNNT